MHIYIIYTYSIYFYVYLQSCIASNMSRYSDDTRRCAQIETHYFQFRRLYLLVVPGFQFIVHLFSVIILDNTFQVYDLFRVTCAASKLKFLFCIFRRFFHFRNIFQHFSALFCWISCIFIQRTTQI